MPGEEDRWEQARLDRLAESEDKRAAMGRKAQRIAREDRSNWIESQAENKTIREARRILFAPYYLKILGTLAGNLLSRQIEKEEITEGACLRYLAEEGQKVTLAETPQSRIVCHGRQAAYLEKLRQLRGISIEAALELWD